MTKLHDKISTVLIAVQITYYVAMKTLIGIFAFLAGLIVMSSEAFAYDLFWIKNQALIGKSAGLYAGKSCALQAISDQNQSVFFSFSSQSTFSSENIFYTNFYFDLSTRLDINDDSLNRNQKRFSLIDESGPYAISIQFKNYPVLEVINYKIETRDGKILVNCQF